MVCLSFLTKAWLIKATSLTNFWMLPSTIFSAILAGLPDSNAFWVATLRSFSMMSAGTPVTSRETGLVAAICMATSLAAVASPLYSTRTPILPLCS